MKHETAKWELALQSLRQGLGKNMSVHHNLLAWDERTLLI